METPNNRVSPVPETGLDSCLKWTSSPSFPLEMELLNPSHIATAIIPAFPFISPPACMIATATTATTTSTTLDNQKSEEESHVTKSDDGNVSSVTSRICKEENKSSEQGLPPLFVHVDGNSTALLELDEDLVNTYLNQHPDFANKWLNTNTTAEIGKDVALLDVQGDSKLYWGDNSGSQSCLSVSASCSSNNSSPDHSIRPSLNYSCSPNSKNVFNKLSPLIHKKNKSHRSKKVDPLSEPEMFMELIRDVSTELDIDTLCHKILVNVGNLTHADRASLFLTQGPKQNKCLVAKLFDVTVDSDLNEALRNAREKEILMPWGVGIVGHVARTKEIINIKDAYEDSRFDASIDERTGYRTESILCMPVCNFEGDVIGVAEIINKKNGTREFTSQDVEVFRRYLAFCGIGIQNAQLFDLSMREYKRNQMLLQLAKGIFAEQTSLDRLVSKIMLDATDILKCERCFVYLLNSQDASERDRKASQSTEVLEGGCSFDSKDHFRPRMSSDEKEEPENTVALNDQKESEVFTDSRMADIPSPTKVLSHKPSTNWSFHTSFELRSSKGESRILSHSTAQLFDSPHAAIASYVCDIGRTVNISDVQDWLGTPLEHDGLFTFSVLSIPIFDSNKQILGVAQMINKESGLQFSDYDISTFEAFATFCGLGIQNTQVYENACRLMARQKVALECLSYHATASREDTETLRQVEISSAKDFNLYSYDFNDFNLSDIDTCKCVMRMFVELHLLEKFAINYEVMCRWILSVKKNYRPVKYHNWRHALNVAQTMFAILKTGKIEKFVNDLEMLGLLVACLSHDLDHRGTNNQFQTKTDSPLAILYSTSTMEHHHFDQCVMILSQDSNNIFRSLSAEDYSKVMRLVENAILSTDMGLYFKKKNTFLELSDNGEFDWQSPDKKELLCGMMMTACDVSAIAKPWEVQHKTAKLVADEFFEQGDLEKLKLNQEPIAMMDREKRDELPKMQVGFIDFICLPLYKALSESFPWVKPLYDGCARNKEQWQILADQVDMGLTWIDHEYIDKPVERNETEISSRITLLPKAGAAISSPSSRQSHGHQIHRLTSISGISANVNKGELRGKMKRSLKMKLGKKNVQACSKEAEVEKSPEKEEIVESPIENSPKEIKSRKSRSKFCSIL